MRNTEGLSLKVLMKTRGPAIWRGRRRCGINATVGYGRRERLRGGKQSKSMAFAANAKRIRTFLADLKVTGIQMGRYVEAPLPTKRTTK